MDGLNNMTQLAGNNKQALIEPEQRMSGKQNLAGLRFDRLHKQIFLFVFCVLFVSGLVWIVYDLLSYASTNQTFNSQRMPTSIIKLHGAFAMLFMLLLGSVWEHIRAGWRMPVLRRSGIILLIVFAVLILSAWMLYYVGDDSWQNMSRIVHSAFGILAAFICTKHVLGR